VGRLRWRCKFLNVEIICFKKNNLIRFVKKHVIETITIEIRNPKAKKLIDDLVDLELISVQNSWNTLWEKLIERLPQNEPEMTESEVMEEIEAYRLEKGN
jgi:hypothetical protein